MVAGSPRGIGAAAKRTIRGAVGAISPRLLRRIQRARARARYRRDPIRGPRYLLLEPITACNYHCLMCPDHSSLLATHVPAKAMPWEQLEGLLRDAAAMGTEEVWLAGRGEPLLYPQVVEAIALATSLGMRSTITTNAGRLSDALADQLCDAGLTQLSISVNAASPETYARVHEARPEERARILSLMKRLSARPRHPRLFASMVLLKPNASELLDFARDAIEAGANDLDLLGLRRAPLFPTLSLDDDEWPEVRRDLATAGNMARRAGVEFRTSCIPGDGEQAQPERSHWTLGCFVGYFFSRVDVDGNIHGCCSCANFLGRLADAPLPQLWHSSAYQRFRRVCREIPATGLVPPQCSCGDCGNVAHNATAHDEMELAPVHPYRESQFATRLDLARIVWRHLGDLLGPAGEAAPYADLTPDEAGPAWSAVAGLHAAEVMVGEPMPDGRRHFWPQRAVGYAEAALVLRRSLARLGTEPDRGERLIASTAPKLTGQAALLKPEVQRWARRVRAGAGLRRRPG